MQLCSARNLSLLTAWRGTGARAHRRSQAHRAAHSLAALMEVSGTGALGALSAARVVPVQLPYWVRLGGVVLVRALRCKRAQPR